MLTVIPESPGTCSSKDSCSIDFRIFSASALAAWPMVDGKLQCFRSTRQLPYGAAFGRERHPPREPG